MRSGMMKAAGLDGLASAASSRGKGRFSLKRSRRSSSAASSSTTGSSFWPLELRFIQRFRLATQSVARTGSPSWKRRPLRSVKVQARPSSATSCPSAICGCGWNAASIPYSTS